MSREQFEKLFPVPGWMYFTAGRYTFSRTDDPITDMDRLDPALRMSFLWQGFQAAHQSRQPEIDELVNMLNQAFGPDDPLVGWRGAASRADLFRCEFCGAEHLDDSQLEHAPHCLVTKGRALIAKHKGEA